MVPPKPSQHRDRNTPEFPVSFFLLLVHKVAAQRLADRSNRSLGPLPRAHDLLSVSVWQGASLPGVSIPAQGPFPWEGRENQEPRRPSDPSVRPSHRGGHLPGSALHCSPLRRLRRRGSGRKGEGAADLGTGDAAAARKPSRASAANCPEPEGAPPQGLRARGVTFPGLWQLLRAQLRVPDNHSGPGERSFKLSRLLPCCLKGRLSTSHSAYW